MLFDDGLFGVWAIVISPYPFMVKCLFGFEY